MLLFGRAEKLAEAGKFGWRNSSRLQRPRPKVSIPHWMCFCGAIGEHSEVHQRFCAADIIGCEYYLE
jgi:hypothetical protein